MITSAFDKFRDEPGKGLTAILGVVLIVLLLWAIGHVAQGQVRQAQARGDGQLQAQAMALRCGSAGATTTQASCAERRDYSPGAQGAASDQPVYVSYR